MHSVLFRPINEFWHKSIGLIVVLTWMALALPSAVAFQSESTSSESGKMFLHVDVSQWTHSQTGKLLAESLIQIPFVEKQLSSIPDSLSFLTDASYESITLQVDGDRETENVTLQVVGNFDSAKLVEMLTHAKGYAKVQFGSVDIHHWVTDLESLGVQFMGQDKDQTEARGSDGIYLAMPKPGRLVASTSLSNLTELLSKSPQQLEMKSDKFNQFGAGENLASLYVNVQGMEIPGELVAVVRENADGQLQIRSVLKGRNSAERMTASGIATMLNNPSAIVQMFPEKPEEKAEGTSGKKEVELTSGTEDPKHMNRMSIGFSLNPASIEQGDWRKMIECFVKDCIDCRLKNDELSVDIQVFLGRCRVINTPMDSPEAIAKGQKFNSMQLTIDAFSTAEQLEAAKRVAKQPAAPANPKRR